MEEEPPPLTLLDLPDELLTRVLRHVGARAVACAASVNKRLHACGAQLRDVPDFSSALLRIRPGEEPAARTAEAVRAALERMTCAVDLAVLFYSSPPQARRGGLCRVLDAAAAMLPPGCVLLGVTGSHVSGPDAEAAGAPTEAEAAVVVFLGRTPGLVATVSRGPYPKSEEAQDKWLQAPADHQLAWQALFTVGNPKQTFNFLPHAAARWPAARVFGGVASQAEGTAAETAVAVAGGSAAVACNAAALSLFAPPSPGPCSAWAGAIRGLVPCSSVWTVAAVENLGELPHGEDDKTVPFPHRLCVSRRVTAFEGSTAANLASELAEAASEFDDPYIRLWAGAEEGDEEAAAAAVASSVQLHPMLGSDVLMWAPQLAPALQTALAAGTLRCQAFRISAAASAGDAAGMAARQGCTRPGSAGLLAAACSGRGEGLYGQPGVEAAAFATGFPWSHAAVVVNGELGPPPEGGLPIRQTFTTTLGVLSAN